MESDIFNTADAVFMFVWWCICIYIISSVSVLEFKSVERREFDSKISDISEARNGKFFKFSQVQVQASSFLSFYIFWNIRIFIGADRAVDPEYGLS